MEIILVWQLVVAASIAISRMFSSTAMIAVALFWTAWTFLALWFYGLIILQLGTAWGTVWLLSSFFGETAGVVGQSDAVVESQAERRAAPEQAPEGTASASAVNGTTAAPAKEWKGQAASEPLTRSSITSILAGVTNVTNASTTALEGFNKAVGSINDRLILQNAKAAANQEILAELYALLLTVEAALRRGEQEREIQQKLAASPLFAEIYTDLKTRLEGASPEKGTERKLELQAITAAPKRPDELPPLAADEREEELTRSLRLLESTEVRVTNERELLQSIDKAIEGPFLNFLVRQQNVLRQHLAILSPEQPHGQDHTTTRSRGADDLSVGEPRISAAPTKSPLNARPSTQPHFESLLATSHTASTKQEVGQASAVVDNTDPVPQIGALLLDQWERKKGIESFARELGIPHLVHFTRCENLAGILSHGLVSISTCDKQQLAFVRNDTDRWDGQPDGISLSVAFPNYRMFYKYRQIFNDADWAVLLISPRVLWEKDCAFYRHNAADARVSRQDRDRMKSLQSLRDMFAEDVGTREAWLRRFDPSDPQAEILVYETISPSCVEAVAFETREARARYIEVLGGLESFYAGPGKGLFGARSRARAI